MLPVNDSKYSTSTLLGSEESRTFTEPLQAQKRSYVSLNADEDRCLKFCADLSEKVYEIYRNPSEIKNILKDYIADRWEILATSKDSGFLNYYNREDHQILNEYYKELQEMRRNPKIIADRVDLSPPSEVLEASNRFVQAETQEMYYGFALFHPERNQLIKVNRGTNPITSEAIINGDHIANLQVFFETPSQRTEYSLKFTDYCESIVKEKYPDKTYKKISTGHSAGGYQAHFDGALREFKAIGYDNPFLSEKVLSHYGDEVKIHLSEMFNNPNFISVQSNPDHLNHGGGLHEYGVVFRVDLTGNDLIGLFSFGLSLRSHKMDQIADKVFKNEYWLPGSVDISKEPKTLNEISKTKTIRPLVPEFDFTLLSKTHPLMLGINGTLEEVMGLQQKLEEGIKKGIVTDKSIMSEVIRTSDMAEDSASELKKQWNKEGTFWSKSLECAAIITKSLADKLQQDRSEAYDDFLDSENDKEFARKKERMLGQNIVPQTPYNEIYRFTHYGMHPNGLLSQSITELKEYSKDFLKKYRSLENKIAEAKKFNEKIHSIGSVMDSTDKSLQKIYRSLLNDQRKISSAVGTIALTLQTAAAIMTVCNPGATYTACTLAAAGVAQLSYEIIGKRTDEIRRSRQQWQSDRLYARESLSQAASINRDKIGTYEGMVYQLHNILVTQPDLLDSKSCREGLKTDIENNQKDLHESQERIKKTEKDIEKINQDISRLNFATYVHKHYPSREEDRLKTEAELQNCEALLAEAEKRHSDEQENWDNLNAKNKDSKKCLKDQEFLAPMREQIEQIIHNEQKRYEYPRDKKDNDLLSKKGLAQNQMRLNFSKYNEARMMERNLVHSGLQATRGVTLELCHAFQSWKPAIAIDIAEQLYHLYDLQKHFKDFAFPQFEEFIKLLDPRNEESLIKHIKNLNYSEMISIYVIPGVRCIAAGATVFRLVKSLASSHPSISPEQSFLLEVVQNATEQQQNFVLKQMQYLENRLERIDDKLTNELADLRNDLCLVVETLQETIDGAKNEILRGQCLQDRNQYASKIEEKKSEFKVRDDEFYANLKLYGPKKRKIKVHKYLNALHASFLSITSPSLNGLTVSQSGEDRLSYSPKWMTQNPASYTGVLAWKTGKISLNVPNLELFQALKECYLGLKDYIDKSSKFDRKEFEKTFSKIEKVIQKQNGAIITLKRSYTDFLHSARSDKNALIEFLMKRAKRVDQDGMFVWKRTISSQITDLLPHARKSVKSRIGPHKFFLSELVTGMPLITTDEALHLNKMRNYLSTIRSQKEAIKLSANVSQTGMAMGIPAGLLGAAIGAAITSGLSYTALTSLSILHQSGHYIADCLRGDNSYWEFYNRAEARVLELMKKPLNEVATHKVISISSEHLNFLSDPKKGQCTDVQFTSRFTFSNKIKKIQLISYTYFCKDIDGSNEYKDSKNINENQESLLLFDIKCDTPKKTLKIKYHRNSFLQRRDIEKIPPYSIPKEYESNVQKMHNDYFEYLDSIEETQPMEADNPFKEIAKDAYLVPSLEEEILPLAFPKAFLKALELSLFSFAFDIKATKLGSFVPFFDFKKSSKGYSLSIHFRLKPYKGIVSSENFCSFEVASFDRAAVESFRKISFNSIGSGDTQKYTYKISQPNIQEFLIQAMYSGYYGLGLPGKGTARMGHEGLYAPYEVYFDGLFRYFNTYPSNTIKYYSIYRAKDMTHILKGRAKPKAGKDYLKVWKEVQKRKRDDKHLKVKTQTYQESFGFLQAIITLSQNIDSSSASDCIKLYHGLFDPEDREGVYNQVYLEILKQETSKKIPENTIPPIPEIKKDLSNGDDTTWLYAAMQWFHKFPRFKEAFLEQLNDESAGHIEAFLCKLSKKTVVADINDLKKSLQSLKLYSKDSDNFNEINDFFKMFLPKARIGRKRREVDDLAFVSLIISSDTPSIETALCDVYKEKYTTSKIFIPEHLIIDIERKGDVIFPNLPRADEISIYDMTYEIIGVIEKTLYKFETSSTGKDYEIYIPYTKEGNQWVKHVESSYDPTTAEECYPKNSLYLLQRKRRTS